MQVQYFPLHNPTDMQMSGTVRESFLCREPFQFLWRPSRAVLFPTLNGSANTLPSFCSGLSWRSFAHTHHRTRMSSRAFVFWRVRKCSGASSQLHLETLLFPFKWFQVWQVEDRKWSSGWLFPNHTGIYYHWGTFSRLQWQMMTVCCNLKKNLQKSL